MRVFITGATGFVGVALTKALADKGVNVNALVRSKRKADALLNAPGINICEGDILTPASLKAGMEGCDATFHLAAYAGIWSKDPRQFFEVNVQGTKNVLEAAHQVGVRRIVCTSTGGVMGPSPAKGVLVHENTNPEPILASAYERSKLDAERLAFSYLEKGMEIIVLNPTRIFGPGELTESNSVTKLIKQFKEGKWRIIPGDGESIGNYVYLDDVVQGHLLAQEKGKPGQRYIIGGENISYNALFQLLRHLTGSTQRLITAPLPIMMTFAQLETTRAKLSGKKPLIVPEFVRKLTKDWAMDSSKAARELGYVHTPMEVGVSKTLSWLQERELSC